MSLKVTKFRANKIKFNRAIDHWRRILTVVSKNKLKKTLVKESNPQIPHRSSNTKLTEKLLTVWHFDRNHLADVKIMTEYIIISLLRTYPHQFALAHRSKVTGYGNWSLLMYLFVYLHQSYQSIDVNWQNWRLSVMTSGSLSNVYDVCRMPILNYCADWLVFVM